jgi:nucleoside phosphorylase
MSTATTTLVCFAVKEEAAPFRQFVQQNPSVSMVVTGMGKRNAERAVKAALELHTPTLVLTSGFAGGLDPKLDTGVVLYEAAPETGLVNVLEKLGARPAVFYCATRMAVTAAEKRVLRETTKADAVEMESHAIHALCRERTIPCATIRVISDTANEDLPLDFNAFVTPDDQFSYTRLALAVMKSPGSIPALIALQKRTASAAANLAHTLKKLLETRG